MGANFIIEVKKSYYSFSQGQVNKFIDSSLSNYLNPYGKDALLYIEIASARANPNTTSWSTNSPWSNGIEAASESGVVIRWFDIVDQPANTYFPKF